jgi:CHAT domain
MSVVVEFKEFGMPAQVLFGLADSAGVAGWQYADNGAALLAAIDQLPWGQQPPETAPAVQDAGRMLRTMLGGVAPLESALVDAFGAGALGVRPLYFRTGKDPSVEAVPFEALWDGHLAGFPCLEQSWPIGRIPADVPSPAGPFVMERTVRVAAIVGAEGIDPRRQVQALLDGCAATPDLSVELTVLTTTQAAIDLVAAAGMPGWRADFVPATSDDLVTRLRGVQPHLLHVFCHGTADGPRLLVAQKDDLAVLELSAEHFGALAKPAWFAPWLTTLNCCEGAAPGEQTVSLASGLVRTGLPAVVGMRRVIDVGMTHGFCTALYRAVLARLAAVAANGRIPAPLSWPEVLFEPRRGLCAGFGAPGVVACRQKEWTMPVLYVASPDLTLRGRPTASAAHLDDQQVRNKIFTIGTADALEAAGNLPPPEAAGMRNPALDSLYPSQ